MNSKIKSICKKLNDANFQAYIVGGACRDHILNKIPKDIDIVTDASPAEIKEVFKEYSALDVGVAFGITTIIIDGEPVEIAQMRMDGDYSDGRRPDMIRPIRDIEKDLARRDFRMNAIAMDPIKGTIIDPFAGGLDIADKIISFVGEPSERIAEDSLRILRAFRFMSQLGFTIEDESLEAIEKYFLMGNDLSKISQERITAEFMKIIVGQNAFNTIKLMTELDILQVIIPEIKNLFIEHNNHWHLERMEPFGMKIISHVLYVFKNACEKSDSLILRLGALLHDIAKPDCRGTKPSGESNYHGHDIIGAIKTEEILTRMRFPNEIINRVSRLVKYHMNIHEVPKIKKTYKLRRLMGKSDFDLMVLLGMCDSLGSHNENGDPIDNEAKLLSKKVEEYKVKFPEMLPPPIISGEDLIKAGLKPGPEFKERLDKTYNYQLNGENNKQKLINHAIGLIL